MTKTRNGNSALGVGAAIDRCIALDRECIRRKAEACEKLSADYSERIERVRARVPDDLREAFDRAIVAALTTELIGRAMAMIGAKEPEPEAPPWDGDPPISVAR
jgi:hypothetical protein